MFFWAVEGNFDEPAENLWHKDRKKIEVFDFSKKNPLKYSSGYVAKNFEDTTFAFILYLLSWERTSSHPRMPLFILNFSAIYSYPPSTEKIAALLHFLFKILKLVRYETCTIQWKTWAYKTYIEIDYKMFKSIVTPTFLDILIMLILPEFDSKGGLVSVFFFVLRLLGNLFRKVLISTKNFLMLSEVKQDGRLPPAYFAPSHFLKKALERWKCFFLRKTRFLHHIF